MQILITGDSHTGPLQRGLEKLAKARSDKLNGHEITIRPLGGGHLLPYPFFRVDGNVIVITQPEFRKNIWQFPLKSHPNVAWYGVSAPLHSARVYRHDEWARHALPDDEGPGAPVSHAMLARLVDDDQRYVKAFILALQARGDRPFAIEGPHPFRHHPAVATVGADKVIRIDRYYRARMRKWLDEHGIPIVRVPARFLDAEGFMVEEMSKGPEDAHHGNERFGARMIEKTLKLLDALDQGRVPANED